MKKVLFATTALVAFTGAAAAEVAISGYAEMGILGADGVDTQFHQDIEVTFKMSGETDGGLSFGAQIDLDETNVAAGDDSGTTVFIKGAFGTLTMGDTDGALDWALTEAGNMGNPGTLADDETTHSGYNGSYLDGTGDNQVVRYDYSFGDFGVAVSAEQRDGLGADAGTETTLAIGGKYSMAMAGGSLNLGLGFQDADSAGSVMGVSAVYAADAGLTVGVVYSAWDLPVDSNASHIGVGVGYETGALSMHANWGQYDIAGVEETGYGLAVAYDLGGGAGVHFGYGDADTSGATFSAGLAMSF
jgi:outer membrane protein OmpU